MRKFDVLSKDLDSRQNYFLEASAGTGKTFAIEHMVCRLLLRGCRLNEILLVTFTKAATRDLKHRVLSNIKRAIDLLENKEQSEILYLNELIKQDEKTCFDALLLLKKAYGEFFSAQIYTIHGFCYRMIKEHAFEAKTALEILNPDEVSLRGYYIEHIFQLLRDGIDEAQLSSIQLMILQKSFKKDFSKLLFFISQLIGLDKGIEKQTTFEEHYMEFCDSSRKSPLDIEELERHLVSYKDIFTKTNWKQFESEIALLKKGLKEEIFPKEIFNQLLSYKDSILSKITQENRKKRINVEEKELIQLERSCACWNALFQKVKDPSRIQLLFARVAQEYLKQSIAKKDSLIMDQLLEQMKKSMQSNHFKNLVSEKYRVVIIDEFQDTDPLQWEIFYSLFFQYEEKTFIVVGDPKQSIYSFRNADLSTYFRAKQQFLSQEQYALGTNFRSDITLIEGLNVLFSKAPKWLNYYQVEGKKGKNELLKDGRKAIHFFGNTYSSEKSIRSTPPKEVEEKVYFTYIANEIARLKNQGLSLQDIVILVKDRFQAHRLEEILRQSKIAAISNAKTGLEESLVFEFFYLAFTIIQKPTDLSSIKRLLSLGIFTLDVKVLQESETHPFFQEIMCYFKKAKLFCEGHHVTELLRMLFYEPLTENLSSLYVALLMQDSLEMYHDTMQLLELLLNHSHEFHRGVEDLLEFMQKIKRRSIEENQTFLRKPAKEGPCVTIMTIFNSKGLEFEIVFAYGIINRYFQKKPIHYSLQERQYKIFDIQKEIDREEILAREREKFRQLYVALTRAKSRVYIPFYFEQEPSIVSLGTASPAELFYISLIKNKEEIETLYEELPNNSLPAFIEILDRFPNLFSYTRIQEEEKEILIEEEKPVISLHEPLQIDNKEPLIKRVSFSSLSETHIKKQEDIALEYPSGAETGNLLHLIFEKIVQLGLLKEKDEKQREGLIEKTLCGTLLMPYKKPISKMIEKTLLLSFPEGFSLSEVDPSYMIQEMEFLFPFSGKSIMKGFIDLAFAWKGKYYIVDWKSNALPSYDVESMHLEMMHCDYLKQGGIYTEAMRLYVNKLGLNFEENFGGVHYIFLRGPALYSFAPAPFNVEELWKAKH